jgi:protein-S-isoprenylcysteine O-methyltransferase Ste14
LVWAYLSAKRAHVPLLEMSAFLGLLCALIWALLSAMYVAYFGLTPADLAHQPEASITFPGARLEGETSADAGFDILFAGLSPARFGRDYRTPAALADVVAFYRGELESRGWSVLVGSQNFDACARGLKFSLSSQFTSATFAIEISQFYFDHPPECRGGMPPAPEAVALVAVGAFTAYIARASLLQRRARRVRGDPLRTARGVARWGPAFAFVPYLILDARPGPTIAPSELIVDIGLALVIVGAAFALWAASTLGAQFDLEPEVHHGHRVVRAGPYGFVRHPVYVGMAVHLVGASVASGNLALILGVLLVGFPLLYLRAHAEEQLLRAELGPAYDVYARDVGMFVPRPTRRRV